MRLLLFAFAALLPSFASSQAWTLQDQGSGTPDSRPAPPRLDPTQLRARSLFGQAQTHLERGQDAEARKLCEKAAQLDPSYPAPLLVLGQAAFAGKNFRKAEGWYRRALDLDPRNPDLLSVVTECHLQTGDLSAAQSWLDVAEEMGCASQTLSTQRIRLLMAQERWKEAKSLLGARLENSPADPLLQRLLLRMYELRGEWGPALPLAQALHQRNPSDRSMRFRYWRLLLAAQRHEKAATEMEEALRVAPSDHQTRTMLIELYGGPFPQPERKTFHEAALPKKGQP